MKNLFIIAMLLISISISAQQKTEYFLFFPSEEINIDSVLTIEADTVNLLGEMWMLSSEFTGLDDLIKCNSNSGVFIKNQITWDGIKGNMITYKESIITKQEIEIILEDYFVNIGSSDYDMKYLINHFLRKRIK